MGGGASGTAPPPGDELSDLGEEAAEFLLPMQDAALRSTVWTEMHGEFVKEREEKRARRLQEEKAKEERRADRPRHRRVQAADNAMDAALSLLGRPGKTSKRINQKAYADLTSGKLLSRNNVKKAQDEKEAAAVAAELSVLELPVPPRLEPTVIGPLIPAKASPEEASIPLPPTRGQQKRDRGYKEKLKVKLRAADADAQITVAAVAVLNASVVPGAKEVIARVAQLRAEEEAKKASAMQAAKAAEIAKRAVSMPPVPAARVAVRNPLERLGKKAAKPKPVRMEGGVGDEHEEFTYDGAGPGHSKADWSDGGGAASE